MYIYATLDIECCHSLKVRQYYSVYQIRIMLKVFFKNLILLEIAFNKVWWTEKQFMSVLDRMILCRTCNRFIISWNISRINFFSVYWTFFGKWVYLVMFHQQTSAINIRNRIIMIVIGFIAITKSWYLMVHVFPTHDNWINGIHINLEFKSKKRLK